MDLIGHAIYARVSPNGYIYSNTFLSRSLVTIMFNVTRRTRSTVVLACGFFIVVKIGLIYKSFIKVVTSHLEPDPFSNTTFCWRRYLCSPVLFNNWLTLADNLSIYSSLPSVTSYMSNVVTSAKPTRRGVNHCHSGETIITLDSSTARMLLYYITYIWTYQVYMYHIPRF